MVQSRVGQLVHAKRWRRIRQITLAVEHDAAGLDDLVVDVNGLLQGQLLRSLSELPYRLAQPELRLLVELRLRVRIELAEAPVDHAKGLRVHKLIVYLPRFEVVARLAPERREPLDDLLSGVAIRTSDDLLLLIELVLQHGHVPDVVDLVFVLFNQVGRPVYLIDIRLDLTASSSILLRLRLPIEEKAVLDALLQLVSGLLCKLAGQLAISRHPDSCRGPHHQGEVFHR